MRPPSVGVSPTFSDQVTAGKGCSHGVCKILEMHGQGGFPRVGAVREEREPQGPELSVERMVTLCLAVSRRLGIVFPSSSHVES